MDINTTLRRWWPVLLAALAVLGVTVTVTQGDNSTSINVTVNGQLTPTGTTGPATITAERDQVEKLQRINEHKDLGGLPALCPSWYTAPGPTATVIHNPIGFDPDECVTRDQMAEGVAQRKALARKDKLPEYDVAAASSIAGCRSRFIKRNYSNRGGVWPRIIVLHQTISPDNGWIGVNNITAYFNMQGPDVSSHLVVAGAKDACNYIVPMSQKAWTQTGFNSLAISIEVTGTQSQGYYVKGPGRTRLAKSIARIGKSWGIPIRRGAVSGCTVTRSGVVDHDQLGACGGFHNDVRPYRGSIPGIIDLAQHYRTTLWQTPAQRRCGELKSLRQRARWRKRTGRTPMWTKPRAQRARALKRVLGPQAARCR